MGTLSDPVLNIREENRTVFAPCPQPCARPTDLTQRSAYAFRFGLTDLSFPKNSSQLPLFALRLPRALRHKVGSNDQKPGGDLRAKSFDGGKY
jgi:hypothetical protein